LTVDTALELAARVLTKSMDTTSPSADKLEFAVVSKDPVTQEVTQKMVPTDVIAKLMKKAAEEQAQQP